MILDVLATSNDGYEFTIRLGEAGRESATVAISGEVARQMKGADPESWVRLIATAVNDALRDAGIGYVEGVLRERKDN